MIKIQTIIDYIDDGTYALPEFQRGYVWSRDQVKKLMVSLYKDYPIGSLLVWETPTENAAIRGDEKPTSGTVTLILDGQQRITSLYGIVKGYPPKFFEGNSVVRHINLGSIRHFKLVENNIKQFTQHINLCFFCALF